MSKRAVAPPQTLVIPVSLDANQVYSVTVNMSSNPAPQSFAFALTTSTASNYNRSPVLIATLVGAFRRIIPSISSSVQQLPQSQNSNGSAWSYPNQTVTVANQSTSFFPSGVSGMIGMGLAPFADSPAAGWLSRNPAQPAFSYGMALNPPSASNSSGSGGELHWLQPDASFYEGEVTWKTMVTANASNPANMSTWFVEMDAFSVSGPPGLQYLPERHATPHVPRPILRGLSSSRRAQHAQSTLTSRAHRSTRPPPLHTPGNSRATPSSVSQSRSGLFRTSLDQSALVVKQADGVCVGVLQEWIDAKATQYLLGSPFIAVLYLIFSFSQSGDGTMGVAARAAKDNKLAPGAIAGVVLGTLAVVALIVIAGVLLYFAWQRRSRVPRRRKPSKTDITPFTDISPTTSRTSQHLSSGVGDQRGLLASLPGSPDWATTFMSDGGSPNSNIFPGGTFTESRTSRQYLDPNSNGNMNSSTSLIHLESPPPYANPNGLGPPPVPLVPLRKTRNRS
ncbi:hypothetical protein B0H14DRAFT_3891871 [Mycena olivaceomarginata]|nr:hypothetical protein B0H14DRAFT_3891871 [Mycena olivaceomarginata]